MGEAILTTGAEGPAGQRAVDDWTVAWSARGNPAQMALLKCPIFEVFFGGARGGGKTDGMLGEWVQHADRYGKNAIGLMLRRTRTELIETIERSRAIYSPLGWTYNETEKMWRTRKSPTACSIPPPLRRTAALRWLSASAKGRETRSFPPRR